ncbi:uncharacterized protein LOC110026730 isoform X2 [Phalaenopsis equestris]|uniref:uncharacterized protein LOC110026730 isoform X2 n=1 Tax=Phalaenopsis equestris TaxID=78828 RepID=UPI0009E5FF07|nr:uncharacterized protein LOC110026730 isoform X2 [Phalaenopsis equestris]
MAGEEMTKQSSGRRRSTRAGSTPFANVNGGGVLLLLGAAAGALLASAFAAHRIRAHKRRRGSTTEGIQRDSCEHLGSHEAKELVVNKEGAGDEANGEEGVVEVNSHENLDACVQISKVDQTELDFYLIEERKGEVVERSPATDMELVDGEYGKLAGCIDSSADNCSSLANICGNLEIDSSLGEALLRYDDDKLVAVIVREKRKISSLFNKEDDEEDDKSANKVEWSERKEIETKNTSSIFCSEQSRLLEVNTFDDLHCNLEFLNFVKGELDIYFDDKMAKSSLAKEYELGDGVEGELAKIGSSPANVYNDLGIDSSLGKVQLRHDVEQLVTDIVSKEIENPFINRKEDEEDSQKPYIEEGAEREELEGEITHSNLNIEELCLPEKEACQNLEMVEAIEERKFEDDLVDEMHNSILEFVFSRSIEMEKISPFGDQDEINSLIEDIKPFFGSSVEAKMALDMTKNDSGKHLIMEDKFVLDSGSFKDVLREDILSFEHENENEDGSDEKMVEGSRDLCERTVALPHESSVSILSEPEENSCKDLIMVMTKEDVPLITHNYGIAHIEEDNMELEEIYSPLDDEGVEGSIHKIQGAKACIHDNPTMFIMMEEKIQQQNNVLCDLNASIQKETTEENLSDGFIKNVESSETEENLREHKECSLTESNTVQFSPEHDNLMAFNESPPIQFQGIEPIEREEKARIEDCDEEDEILKLSFDVVDNGGKILAELVDADRENQCQVEGHGSNVSSEGKQQIAVKKVKGIDYMFLVTAIAIVFTFLIFLYTKDFITRTTILENFITG